MFEEIKNKQNVNLNVDNEKEYLKKYDHQEILNKKFLPMLNQISYLFLLLKKNLLIMNNF